jgi:NADPH-dependent curcumin reductase CurA
LLTPSLSSIALKASSSCGEIATLSFSPEEDVIDGLENTPKALIGLLAGENRGKRMVRV